jgi:hypothetical protein
MELPRDPELQLLLIRAHKIVKRFCQTNTLDGYCLEASVIIVEYLRRHHVEQVRLIRRNYGGEGHWNFAINQQEYDPTCADWTNPPTGTVPGSIYKITEHSPHHACPRTRVNNQAAYEITGITRRNFQKQKTLAAQKLYTFQKVRPPPLAADNSSEHGTIEIPKT